MIFAMVQMEADRRAFSYGGDALAQRLGQCAGDLCGLSQAVGMALWIWRPSIRIPVALCPCGRCSSRQWHWDRERRVIMWRRKQPWLLVGWLWYLGMLVPVIGIKQSGSLARADRIPTLPIIGICIAATWAVADWARQSRHRRECWAHWRRGPFGLAGCRVESNSYWRNSITLWTHTLSCTNGQLAFLTHNLGLPSSSQPGALEKPLPSISKPCGSVPLARRRTTTLALPCSGKPAEAKPCTISRSLRSNPVYAGSH